MRSWQPASTLPTLRPYFDDDRSPPALPWGGKLDDPLAALAKAILFPWRHAKRPLLWLSALQFVPVFGSILNRGWRLSYLAQPTPSGYPELGKLPRIVADGLLLWAVYGLFLLPNLFVHAASGFSWFFDLWKILKYIAGALSAGTPAQGFGVFVTDVLVGFLLTTTFVVFYSVASWPVLRVGMMRYAVEGRASALFQLKSNMRIAWEHRCALLGSYIQAKLLIVVALFASGLLAVTVVGGVLIPAVLGPWRILASGLIFRRAMVHLGWLDDSEQWFGERRIETDPEDKGEGAL
ncbi:MAG: DUF4013 domain-containing protein [Acidobacteriota bacterium]